MDNSQIPKKDERTNASLKGWAYLAHLSSLLALIIPFANLLVPFIIYLIAKTENDFVKNHAKASFQFQIGMYALFLGSLALIFFIKPMFDSMTDSALANIIGIFILICTGIIWLVLLTVPLYCMIKNILKVRDDFSPKYPFQIKILS